MNEKEFNNEFRFSLYQGDVLLGERIFDADQFSPFTRNFIDIRQILPRAITKLQKVLSKRNYQTESSDGFDLFQYHQKMISLYPQDWRGGMRYSPQPIVQQIEDKIIRGVECKIGFYINNKTIVERMFYVDGFNPVARWSVDLIDTVTEISDTISNHIRKNDINNMWNDYDLINKMGMTINQIRELHPAKRDEMLRKLSRN